MISFIIPVFNPNINIFKDCLASIRGQSYKDYEVIIVLDGPCNEAKEIANGSKLKNFTILELPHGGVQKARNAGFKASKGEIVSFWDCDCTIEPDTCKTWIEAFNDHKDISFVYSGYKFFGEMGGLPSEEFDPYTLKCGNYISTMFPMRREVFPGFDETLKSLQDWDMWLTVVENGGKGLFIPGYAFSTAYPTPTSISGQGCTNEAWLGRVDAVKIKHNLPDRKFCVASIQCREEGIRLAKLIGADYKDVPNHKPNKYGCIIQIGFSLHPGRAKLHSAIFNQPLNKKIIFWTQNDINEINNHISLHALNAYAEMLNHEVVQYVEDIAAKKIMERAGFHVRVMPIPMINTDEIIALPENPAVLVDINEDYQQILACIEHSLPDIKFDYIDSNKEIKDYNLLLTFNPEKTITFNMKRMLLTGRGIVSNVQSPFCGYVSDTQSSGRFMKDIVDVIRKSVKKNHTSATEYWKEQMKPTKLMEACTK